MFVQMWNEYKNNEYENEQDEEDEEIVNRSDKE